MDNEKDSRSTEEERTRQFFKNAIEEAVERIIVPKFDEQERKIEKLRTDMRIAISQSNADKLKGTITISALITGFGSAILVELLT